MKYNSFILSLETSVSNKYCPIPGWPDQVCVDI